MDQKKMAELKAFANGLKYIEISNSSASACLSLQGAHLFHYRQKGELRLL